MRPFMRRRRKSSQQKVDRAWVSGRKSEFMSNEGRVPSVESHSKRSKKEKSKNKTLRKGRSQNTKNSSGKTQPKVPRSITFQRFFTPDGLDPMDQIRYVQARSQITDAQGKVIFEMNDIEVPAHWSQLAIDILVSKYMRKAGVPKTQHETSIRQVIHRITRTLGQEALRRGILHGEGAKAFEDELAYLLVHQMAAFNSPVWFNLGLFQHYGIRGSSGLYAWDEVTSSVLPTRHAYERPQCSACFIQSVDDELMSIFQLMKNEAQLFKYGSGSGTNFSRIRGKSEQISGGGYSSGLMSFLEVLDKAAGATQSGGTTRRAAKMVCLDIDHPEVLDFMTWKSREERKVAALIQAGYSADFNGEAYRSISGQNSNNSVRVSDQFMRALESGGQWHLRARTSGKILASHDSRILWRVLAQAAWECGDPGVQFDTTINEWNTCARSARIQASNPCSEFMFLDDTACNLASLNLVKFLDADGNWNQDAFQSACRTLILAQELLVDLSSYPTAAIAQNSHDYRPLGLGYANLGSLLMLKGLAYDSEEGRSWAAALTSLMSAHAYSVSAELAQALGPFASFPQNRSSMLKVLRKHQRASLQSPLLKIKSEGLDSIWKAAQEGWLQALKRGERFGWRNAQVSVLAPTGTIGLLMDCDTTGVEPEFALVKFKKLVGGGYLKMVNQSVPRALKNLGYDSSQIEEMKRYLLGTLTLEQAPHVSREFLKFKGLTDEEIQKIEQRLPSVFHLRSAFTRKELGDSLLHRLGVTSDQMSSPQFNLLHDLGLSDSQIEEANEVVCGRGSLEGAPHFRDKDQAVFDCASLCGFRGSRVISPMAHIRMMAGIQPFLSGAISKTVNLPHETTVEQIQEIYEQAWRLGLKAVALYRDGCKFSQPLSSFSVDSSGRSNERLSLSAAVDSKELSHGVKNKQDSFSSSRARRRLPVKRRGFTQEARVAGHKVYLRTGEYEDGSLGEVFIDLHKEGATTRSMMNCFAIAVSLGLQYGVPLEEFVNQFTFTRFDPAGVVSGHPQVKMATSMVDYIFRVLGFEYLRRVDLVQVQQKQTQAQMQALEAPDEEKASGKKIGVEERAQNLEPSSSSQENEVDPLAHLLGAITSDAPLCETCGYLTIRSGSCYKCLHCGNSRGCS